jgi:diaminopimelate epimerase
MRLWRAHGLGNDYLVLEEGGPLSATLAARVCHRHTGVGSDGILEPFETSDADYGVRIWNPDGSLAEKSGNGLRIFARWLFDERGASRTFSVHTGHDRVHCEILEADIRVAMGPAQVSTPEEIAGHQAILVDLGNPHCVIFGDAFPEDWRGVGAALETHTRFQNRTNVQFARVTGERRVEIRIWERGAGETSASGSSSCAVAAAAVHSQRLPSGDLEVDMPGGRLWVRVAPNFEVFLRGPVEAVGRIRVDPTWLLGA